jgi:hypothetical protein
VVAIGKMNLEQKSCFSAKKNRTTDFLQQYDLRHGANRSKDIGFPWGWVVGARMDLTPHKTINKEQTMLEKSTPLDPITL